MDDLKKFIKQNRILFDTEMPKIGHEQRFLKKLEQTQTKKTLSFKFILKIAAVALLGILSSLYVKDKIFNIMNDKTIDIVGHNNTNFSETEQYYKNQINVQINLISDSNNLTKEQKRLLEDEMKKIDDLYNQLQKDLKLMPNDPRIIQAIIKHYQKKTQVLNRIIKDLNNINQLNLPENEKVIL